MLQQWPFRHFKQPGLYTMTFLQQPYTLQVSAKSQILWPHVGDRFYYRLASRSCWQTINLAPRSFVQAYLQQWATRVQALLPPQSVTLGLITDTHMKFVNSRSYYGLNGLQHLIEWLELPQLLPLDLIAHLGDIVDGSDEPLTDQQLLWQASRRFEKQACPYFIVKGNHDDHDKYDEHTAQHLPTFQAQTFSKTMWQPMQQQTAITTTAMAGVGYFDKGLVRLIFLNTSDVSFQTDAHGRRRYDHKKVLALRQQQLQALVDLLTATTAPLVIILGHANLVNSRGQNALQYNGKVAHDLMKAYNQGLKGRVRAHYADSEFNVDLAFDFRQHPTSRIGAYLCGHRHVETQYLIDGIQYILLNVSALMGKKHFLTTKYNRAWERQYGTLQEFAGYVLNIDPQKLLLNLWGYGAASPWRQFKI